MPIEKAKQLIRLAVNSGATKEEGRTAAYAAAQMIHREGLLEAPRPLERALPAPVAARPREIAATPRQMGVGQARPSGDPLARVHVLAFDFADDEPRAKKDFAFPQR
jgi:hypothetical protein